MPSLGHSLVPPLPAPCLCSMRAPRTVSHPQTEQGAQRVTALPRDMADSGWTSWARERLQCPSRPVLLTSTLSFHLYPSTLLAAPLGSCPAPLPPLLAARTSLPGLRCRTQALGTRCSASSIPALFSFRGHPPKYPACWRQRPPQGPPGNALEILSLAGVSGAARGGGRQEGASQGEGCRPCRGEGRGQDPPGGFLAFGGGGGCSRPGGRPQECGLSADTHMSLLPGSQLTGAAGPGQGTQPGKRPGAGCSWSPAVEPQASRSFWGCSAQG